MESLKAALMLTALLMLLGCVENSSEVEITMLKGSDGEVVGPVFIEKGVVLVEGTFTNLTLFQKEGEEKTIELKIDRGVLVVPESGDYYLQGEGEWQVVLKR